MNILFLYLKAFSSTGGIEKYNRLFIKALREFGSDNDKSVTIKSLYDKYSDDRYIDQQFFLSSSGNKISFLLSSIFKAIKSDLIIVSHINLYVFIFIIKLFFPGKKLIILTYGIDIWNNPSFFKRTALKLSDKIITISSFTRSKIMELYDVDEEQISILPCALDPFFTNNADSNDPMRVPEFLQRIKGKRIILTVARLNKTEKFKGYDNVISALPEVIKQVPDLLYIIAGRADDVELSRINGLISKFKLQDHVILPGFISEEDLPYYYRAADIFVMTSKKEGFGIVYLESLYCGTPVIAGNKDGAYDALAGGKLGVLIDPDDTVAIQKAIIDVLSNNVSHDLTDPDYLSASVKSQFGYESFKSNLSRNLQELDGIN